MTASLHALRELARLWAISRKYGVTIDEAYRMRLRFLERAFLAEILREGRVRALLGIIDDEDLSECLAEVIARARAAAP